VAWVAAVVAAHEPRGGAGQAKAVRHAVGDLGAATAGLVVAQREQEPHRARLDARLAGARGELRHLLPPEFARRCDFRTLRLSPGG